MPHAANAQRAEMFIYIYIYTQMQVCKCVCIYIYLYLYLHMHTSETAAGKLCEWLEIRPETTAEAPASQQEAEWIDT